MTGYFRTVQLRIEDRETEARIRADERERIAQMIESYSSDQIALMLGGGGECNVWGTARSAGHSKMLGRSDSHSCPDRTHGAIGDDARAAMAAFAKSLAAGVRLGRN
jgi:hypothetical protein